MPSGTHAADTTVTTRRAPTWPAAYRAFADGELLGEIYQQATVAVFPSGTPRGLHRDWLTTPDTGAHPTRAAAARALATHHDAEHREAKRLAWHAARQRAS